jgi:hypothetical protein
MIFRVFASQKREKWGCGFTEFFRAISFRADFAA